MPCRDYETDYITTRDNEELRVLKERVDQITRLLCFVMGNIEHTNKYKVLDFTNLKCKESSELRVWWKEHKRVEAARVAANGEKIKRIYALKAKALATFSVEELELLDIDIT